MSPLSADSDGRLEHSLTQTEARFNDIDAPTGGRFDDGGVGPSEENFTIANCTMWHHMWSKLLDRNSSISDYNGQKMWDIVVATMSRDGVSA